MVFNKLNKSLLIIILYLIINTLICQNLNYAYLNLNIFGIKLDLNKCKATQNSKSIGLICKNNNRIIVISTDLFIKVINKNTISSPNFFQENKHYFENNKYNNFDYLHKENIFYKPELFINSNNFYLNEFSNIADEADEVVDIDSDEENIVVFTKRYFYIYPNEYFSNYKQITFPFWNQGYYIKQGKIKENAIVSVCESNVNQNHNSKSKYLYFFYFSSLVDINESNNQNNKDTNNEFLINKKFTYNYLRSLYQLPSSFNSLPILNYNIGKCSIMLMTKNRNINNNDDNNDNNNKINLENLNYLNNNSDNCMYLSDVSYYESNKFDTNYSYLYVYKLVKNNDFSYIKFSLLEKFRVPYSCGFNVYINNFFAILGCPFITKNSFNKTQGGILVISPLKRHSYYTSKTLAINIKQINNSKNSNLNNNNYFNSDNIYYYSDMHSNFHSNSVYLSTAKRPIVYGSDFNVFKHSSDYYIITIPDLYNERLYLLNLYTPYITFHDYIKVIKSEAQYINLNIKYIYRLKDSNPYVFSNILYINDISPYIKKTDSININDSIFKNKSYMLYFASEFYADMYYKYDNYNYQELNEYYNYALMFTVCLRNFKYSSNIKYYMNKDNEDIIDSIDNNKLDLKSKHYFTKPYDLINFTDCNECNYSEISKGVQHPFCSPCLNSNDFSKGNCNNYCINYFENIEVRQLQNNNNSTTIDKNNNTLKELDKKPKDINYKFGPNCLSCENFINKNSERPYNNFKLYYSDRLVEPVIYNDINYCGVECRNSTKIFTDNYCFEEISYFNNPNLYYKEILDTTQNDYINVNPCSSFTNCYECTYHTEFKCSWCNNDSICISLKDIYNCAEDQYTLFPKDNSINGLAYSLIVNSESNNKFYNPSKQNILDNSFVIYPWIYQSQCYINFNFNNYQDINFKDNDYCGPEIIINELKDLTTKTTYRLYNNTLNSILVNEEYNPHYINKDSYILKFPIDSGKAEFNVNNIYVPKYYCSWRIVLLENKQIKLKYNTFKNYLIEYLVLYDYSSQSNNSDFANTSYVDLIDYFVFKKKSELIINSKEVIIFFTAKKERIFKTETIFNLHISIEDISIISNTQIIIIASACSFIVLSIIILLIIYLIRHKKYKKVMLKNRLEAIKDEIKREERIVKYIEKDSLGNNWDSNCKLNIDNEINDKGYLKINEVATPSINKKNKDIINIDNNNSEANVNNNKDKLNNNNTNLHIINDNKNLLDTKLDLNNVNINPTLNKNSNKKLSNIKINNIIKNSSKNVTKIDKDESLKDRNNVNINEYNDIPEMYTDDKKQEEKKKSLKEITKIVPKPNSHNKEKLKHLKNEFASKIRANIKNNLYDNKISLNKDTNNNDLKNLLKKHLETNNGDIAIDKLDKVLYDKIDKIHKEKKVIEKEIRSVVNKRFKSYDDKSKYYLISNLY